MPRTLFAEIAEGFDALAEKRNETMNDAWHYCDNLNDPEAARALAGACLTAHATITAFRRDGLDPDSVDWAFVLRELKAALAVAGHPAGTA